MGSDPADTPPPTPPPSGTSGTQFIFAGNVDRDSAAVNYFDGTFGGSMAHTRYVKLHPRSWHDHPSMRAAVLVRDGAAQMAVAQRLGGISLSNHDGSGAYTVVAGSSAASVRQVEAKVAVFGKAYHFGLDKIRK